MACERSTYETWRTDGAMERYDENYYRHILPVCTGKVLDLGCGYGLLALRMAEKPEVESIVMMDKFPMDERLQNDKFIHYERDLSKGFEFAGTFDTIVATEFVEHIKREDIDVVLCSVKAHLDPSGWFCGSTPIKKVPTVNPFHLYEYTFEEWNAILKSYFPKAALSDVGLNCMVWKAQV